MKKKNNFYLNDFLFECMMKKERNRLQLYYKKDLLFNHNFISGVRQGQFKVGSHIESMIEWWKFKRGTKRGRNGGLDALRGSLVRAIDLVATISGRQLVGQSVHLALSVGRHLTADTWPSGAQFSSQPGVLFAVLQANHNATTQGAPKNFFGKLTMNTYLCSSLPEFTYEGSCSTCLAKNSSWDHSIRLQKLSSPHWSRRSRRWSFRGHNKQNCFGMFACKMSSTTGHPVNCTFQLNAKKLD